MNSQTVSDTWERGSPYEQYVGRWSRQIAPKFLSWLELPEGRTWLDVGCGTGALCASILDQCSPRNVIGVEPSEGFLKLAKQNLGSRVQLLPGSASALPLADGTCDVTVSGLVLNFVPDLPAALAEMVRVASPSGTIAAYVWDYADGMEVIKRFWDAASALNPAAAPLHEGTRFPLCDPEALRAAFEGAGLSHVQTFALDLTAEFADFEDYWAPFLGGQGPAPAYTLSLAEEDRAALRSSLRSSLSPPAGGPIRLGARAWAVRGQRRGRAQPWPPPPAPQLQR